jgi:putative SOS response-associated peptidase YedK
MAGLWERWHGEGDDALETCTIIVTEANALLRDVHDRMPVILPPADYAAWLDPENKDSDALSAMLRPIGSAQWTIHPVSQRVNSPRNDGPELVEVMETRAG